jgi:hypothetical protein
LSPAFQKLAEGLTAVHYQPAWEELCQKAGVELLDGERGAPENIDFTFKAEQSVMLNAKLKMRINPLIRQFLAPSFGHIRSQAGKASLVLPIRSRRAGSTV